MSRLRILAFALCFSCLVGALETSAAEGPLRSHLDGTVSVGTSNLVAVNTNDIKMGVGTYLALSSEKSFGGLPFYLTVGLAYVHTSGTLNYSYVSPTASYVANSVNYALDDFDLNIGVRLKILDHGSVRPYLEGGGAGGFFQLSYDKTLQTPSVLAAGTDYKTTEGVLEFGGYGEGGIEFDVSNSVGLRASYRYVDVTTNTLTTVKKEQVHYASSVYSAGLYVHF